MFLGTMLHQLTGKVTFTDEVNGLVGYYNHNGYTFRKQDYMWGEIHKNGEKVSEITGNYMGYLNFDNERYWDAREKDAIFTDMAGEGPDPLPSQASTRTDGLFYLSYSIDEAQAEKERLENI